VGFHVLVVGLKRPPVFGVAVPFTPPHTIISVPDHTAACNERALGAPVSGTDRHLLVVAL
jgi:hypothetical protein